MNRKAVQVLLIEDDATHAELLNSAFQEAEPDYHLTVSGGLNAAREHLSHRLPDVVITGMFLPDGKATELLSSDDLAHSLPVLVLTSHGNEHLAVEAMKAGAMECIVKSAESMARMPQIVERALQGWELLQEGKRAEEGLRGSEEKYRALVENSRDLIYSYEPDEKITFVSSTVSHYGYKPDEVVGRLISEFVHPDDIDHVTRDRKRTLETGNEFPTEFRLLMRDGAYRTVEEIGKIVRDGDRIVCVTGVVRDIAERKNVERALRTSEERLAFAMEAANDGLWDWNISTGEVYFSPRYFTMLGFEPNELPHSYKSWTDLMHPEDRDAAEKIIKEHIRGKMSSFETEFRMRNKSGGWTWVLSRGRAVAADEGGTPTRMVGTHIDITNRKLAEEKLRIAEAAIASSITPVLLADAEGLISYVNDALLELWGYAEAGEILGLSVTSLCDSEPEISEIISSVRSGGTRRGETLAKRKDGSTFYVMLSANLVTDDLGEPLCLMASFVDVSERKKSELALKESEGRYHELFHSVMEGIGLVDENEIILYCNPAYAAILDEESVRDVIGNSIFDYASRDKHELIREQTQKRKNGAVSQYEFEIISAKGKRKIIIVSASPRFDSKKRYIGAFGAMMDITETRRLQQFAARAQRLETAGRIAGQVAHDFNNLLGPLVAYPELIQSELPPDHFVLDYLRDMERAASLMSEINQQLLTLGRRGHYSQEVLNLNNVIDQVLQELGETPPGLNIIVQAAPALMNITGGSAQLHRAITNLVNNARDAMKDQGTLTIKTENYYAEMSSGILERIPQGDYVKLTISDTGCGIKPEFVPIMFDPFVTTKKSDRRRGSGLGLSIVHAVFGDHDAHIDCDSTIDKGTSFYVYFPVTRKAVESEVREDVAGGPESILVVDDDPTQRDVTRKVLGKLKYDVDLAATGEEAIDMMRLKQYDLLILDMIMPEGIDGAETYRQAIEINPNQKAIVVSGFAETERMEEAFRLGAGAYVRKPLTLQSMARAIRKELDRDVHTRVQV